MTDPSGALRRLLLSLPLLCVGLAAAAQDGDAQDGGVPGILDDLLRQTVPDATEEPLIPLPGGEEDGDAAPLGLAPGTAPGRTPDLPEDAPEAEPLAARIVMPESAVTPDPATPEEPAEASVPALGGEPSAGEEVAAAGEGRGEAEEVEVAAPALPVPPAALILPETGPTLRATGALPAARSFRMGFTPLPYDLTPEAFQETYIRIAEHGDIVSHLFDEGVPWTAAANGTTFHPNVEADIAQRRAGTRRDSAVLLSVTPLAQDRVSLAGEWAETGGMPLPERLEGLSFDDPDVVSAFVGYALRMIDRFDPDYFAYALEISDLAGDPEAGDAFVTFASEVHRAVKRVHPDLPVFPTWSLGNRTAFTDDLRAFMEAMEPYSDVLAVSTYPYVWDGVGGEVDRLPADWFAKFADAMPGKPFAVAQTGFLSGTYRNLPNLVWVSAGPEDQAGYVGALLEEAERLGAEFVIWYVPVDYDALWARLETMGMSQWFAQWMRTGLWSADFQPRPALEVWMDWFALPVWEGGAGRGQDSSGG